MEQLRKAWMPWKTENHFPSQEAWDQWLQRRLKVFGDLRMVFLVLATALLLVGYVIDCRPVMLISVLPLGLVLLLTLAVGKTEETLNRTNKTQS